MNEDEFKKLKPGMIVRHAGMDTTSYIVTANYGKRITAVRTIDMTNPSEWGVVKYE